MLSYCVLDPLAQEHNSCLNTVILFSKLDHQIRQELIQEKKMGAGGTI